MYKNEENKSNIRTLDDKVLKKEKQVISRVCELNLSRHKLFPIIYDWVKWASTSKDGMTLKIF